MSKQPPPAPTASAVGPCPTVVQISRPPRCWKFTQHHRTTRPPNKFLDHLHDCTGRAVALSPAVVLAMVGAVVAIAGLPLSGKNIWKMSFFPGQGKVREFRGWPGKFRKDKNLSDWWTPVRSTSLLVSIYEVAMFLTIVSSNNTTLLRLSHYWDFKI